MKLKSHSIDLKMSELAQCSQKKLDYNIDKNLLVSIILHLKLHRKKYLESVSRKWVTKSIYSWKSTKGVCMLSANIHIQVIHLQSYTKCASFLGFTFGNIQLVVSWVDSQDEVRLLLLTLYNNIVTSHEQAPDSIVWEIWFE